MYNMLRTQAVSSVLIAMMLASCVPQDGIIVSIPTATKEPVPMIETVDIPTATEVPATEVPTSTPTPIPTETPEPTPTATKWPPANPYPPNLYVEEHWTFGYEFGFTAYLDYSSGERVEMNSLYAFFGDFHYESLEMTDEGCFLIGSILDKSKTKRGELHFVRVKVNPHQSFYSENFKGSLLDSEALLYEKLEEGKHYNILFHIFDKEKGRVIIDKDLENELGISTQEEWRNKRLIVSDLLEGEGATDSYEFVLYNIFLDYFERIP